MNDQDVFFVIPTYRLRDVGETVELYDEHFWRNGHCGPHDRLRRLQPGQPGEVLPTPGADPDAQRVVLRRPAGEGAVPRATSPAGSGTSGSSRWSRTCSGPATAATATTPSCTPSAG